LEIWFRSELHFDLPMVAHSMLVLETSKERLTEKWSKLAYCSVFWCHSELHFDLPMASHWKLELVTSMGRPMEKRS